MIDPSSKYSTPGVSKRENGRMKPHHKFSIDDPTYLCNDLGGIIFQHEITALPIDMETSLDVGDFPLGISRVTLHYLVMIGTQDHHRQ
jgi:hypothetical protein